MDDKHIYVAHCRQENHSIQTVWEHLEETAELSGEFAEKIELKEIGELAGLLHDIGKATICFDNYIRSGTELIKKGEMGYVDADKLRGKIDHATAGAQYVLKNPSDNPKAKLADFIISIIIKSHHGGLMDLIDCEGTNVYRNKMKKEIGLSRLDEAVHNLESEEVLIERIKKLMSQDLDAKLREKLTAISQNTDIRTKLGKKIMVYQVGLLVRFLFSCLIDADRINTADFENPIQKEYRKLNNKVDWSVLNEKLEKKLAKFSVRNHIDTIRQEVSLNCLKKAAGEQGIYQLMVPTGGGKTLASLRFALNHAKEHNLDRIIYIIPFTAIIDQNAQVMREIFEKKVDGNWTSDVVLEHHSNLTPDEETEKTKLLSDNWDSPIVLSTMVQFLETVFGSGTRSARRMHQLARSVIIFDEIQTIDAKMIYLFNGLMKFLTTVCHSSVLLCTATQPLLDRTPEPMHALELKKENRIIANPEVLYAKLKRVEVKDSTKNKGWTNEEIKDLTLEEIKERKSVLIITNTKKSAYALYEIMKENPVFDCYHLSTNMCPAHRKSTLEEVINCIGDKPENPQKPVVCISTQLIEAGVDIDFGTVIRYIAGFDSIVQAAGRCNRSGRREELGKVYIVNPIEENLDKLKVIKESAEITKRLLNEFKQKPEIFLNDLLSSVAIERYYTYYFDRMKDEMDYKISKKSDIGRRDTLFELLSTNKLSLCNYRRQFPNTNPQLAINQAFKTANGLFKSIEGNTQGIIVPFEKGKEIISELCAISKYESAKGLLKRAQQYSVNVYYYKLENLYKEGIIYESEELPGIFYLREQYYDQKVGLIEKGKGGMDLLLG